MSEYSDFDDDGVSEESFGECECPLYDEKELLLHNIRTTELGRVDLEHRFLRVYNDNMLLKSQCHNVRDQIKRMKVVVAMMDQRQESKEPAPRGWYERQARAATRLIGEQAQRIAALEMENDSWKDRVTAMVGELKTGRNFDTLCRLQTGELVPKCGMLERKLMRLRAEAERLRKELARLSNLEKRLQKAVNANDAMKG